MSAVLPALLFLVTGMQQPVLTASVDRSDVMVGETVTLTIRIDVQGAAPARLGDPALTGLELRGSRDITRVMFDGGVARRVMTRELRLVAVRAGRATIGPVRVERDSVLGETAPITITVTAPSAARLVTVTPRLQAVLDTIRPPVAGDDVMVEVLALPPRVRLGEQLDLITLAWFPRAVRQQLRTPPTLSPPDIQGVWAYRQTSTAGVVASRQVGRQWYDLYASHQVVFPLAAGRVAVGRATVSYVQPLSYSFLSRELQHEVQSESLDVHVEPQPVEGRPPLFSGAAGVEMTVAFAASATTLPPGGAATVEATVAGRGNVALWPEPEIHWPGGLRVYPSGVEAVSDLEDGHIAGTKRFRYLVIADSAGAHLVPGLEYPFFDTDREAYVRASAPGLQLVAPPGTVAAPLRPLPAPPMVREAASPAERLARLARWLWISVFAAPPILVLGIALARRVRLPRGPRTPARDRDTQALEALDRQLRDVLTRRLGSSGHREGSALAEALRAAGVDAGLAHHVARVRDRLQHAVFGPPGVGDPDELAAEVGEVLRALAGEAPGAERRQLVEAALVLALCFGVAGAAAAQGPRPEELYAAGAFRAAADSFTARVMQTPQVPEYWYNLGAAFYRMGEDGRARAAWVRAARLAPRNDAVRQALRLLPADPGGADLLRVYPIRPVEALALAAVVWVAGWAAVVRRRWRQVGMGLLLAGGLAAGAAWRVAAGYNTPAGLVLADDVPLRQAPYGPADAAWRLDAGDAVRVVQQRGSWLLVRRNAAMGWVQAGEVARL